MTAEQIRHARDRIAFGTESAVPIWVGLARRYRPSLLLIKHYAALEAGEGVKP